MRPTVAAHGLERCHIGRERVNAVEFGSRGDGGVLADTLFSRLPKIQRDTRLSWPDGVLCLEIIEMR